MEAAEAWIAARRDCPGAKGGWVTIKDAGETFAEAAAPGHPIPAAAAPGGVRLGLAPDA